MALMVCELCKAEGKETKIPYDSIGVALMEQHFRDEHREDPKEFDPDGFPWGTGADIP